jgi:hypothetical protein
MLLGIGVVCDVIADVQLGSTFSLGEVDMFWERCGAIDMRYCGRWQSGYAQSLICRKVNAFWALRFGSRHSL